MKPFDVLMDAAGDAAGGGGGGGTGTADTAAFDAAKFTADMEARFDKRLKDELKRRDDLAARQRAEEKAAREKADREAKEKAETEAREKAEETAAAASHTARPDAETQRRLKQQEQELAKFRSDLAASEKARMEGEARSKADKLQAALREELSKSVAADRIQAALRIFGPDVRYAEDGSIVGGPDNLPLDDYVTAGIKANEFLLPPKNTGGSGATGGSVLRKEDQIQIESIKAGMKPAEIARASQQIAAALKIARDGG